MVSSCTIYKTTNFIGKRWTLLILLEIYKGRTRWKRYSHIKSGIPEITPKLLSLRLKELQKEQLINKRIDAKKFPVKCEYSLTDAGKEFIKIIKDMKKWALKWKFRDKTCENTDCSECLF